MYMTLYLMTMMADLVIMAHLSDLMSAQQIH
jgi:hypothetical protein